MRAITIIQRINMLVLIIAAQVALSAALHFNVDTAHGTLTLEGRESNGAIMASFRSPEGDGIRIRSSEDSLAVTTLDGTNLISYFNAPSLQSYTGEVKVVMYQLLDDAYAEANRRTWQFSKEDMIGYNVPARIYAYLQSEGLSNPKASLEASYNALVEHPAARLFEPAARALGEDFGIIGKNEPSIMAFYTAAMKLSETYNKNRRAVIAAARTINPWEEYFNRRVNVQAYPNCTLDTCPPCMEDQCIGLCGKGCSCWSFVCGDCCYHEGCKDHDLCCADWYSFGCLAPLGFSCEETYEC